MLNKLLLTCVITLLLSIISYSCKPTSSGKYVIAFYNLENLFDTINTPQVNDEEFTPDGSKKWNSEKYASKLANMSGTISKIGFKEIKNCPDIIGLCEMENKNVLSDLIKQPSLKDKKYAIIHYDSPDKRGIDVALLYKPDRFEVKSSKVFPLIIFDNESKERIFTRDQLLVSGYLGKEFIHIIVNHWPSRYGGKERSIPSRKAAAALNRQIIDSLRSIEPLAKIITMGDLNDDPVDVSVKQILYTTMNKKNISDNELYNPMEKIFKSGKGSLFYKGKWNLFDQIIITKSFIDNSEGGLKFIKAEVFNESFLIQQDGKYKGCLMRTFAGNKYLNGYSDHLPVYMVLKSE